MHKPTESILYVINDSHNKNVPIHEKVCVIPPPYYLDWFENTILMVLPIGMTVHFVSNA